MAGLHCYASHGGTISIWGLAANSGSPGYFRHPTSILAMQLLMTNTSFISSHVYLKKAVSDFWNMRLFHFYKQTYSGMRNDCHHQWKIGYNFKMKRRIEIPRYGFVGKLSDNNLAKFQPNWSRGCRLGVQNAYTTCPNFHTEKQGKIEF